MEDNGYFCLSPIFTRTVYARCIPELLGCKLNLINLFYHYNINIFKEVPAADERELVADELANEVAELQRFSIS